MSTLNQLTSTPTGAALHTYAPSAQAPTATDTNAPDSGCVMGAGPLMGRTLSVGASPTDIGLAPSQRSAELTTSSVQETASQAENPLAARDTQVGTGRLAKVAYAACEFIMAGLSKLSSALLNVFNSVSSVARGFDSYIVQAFLEEMHSLWEDAHSTGVPRPVVRHHFRPEAQPGFLDRVVQRLNNYLNDAINYEPRDVRP